MDINKLKKGNESNDMTLSLAKSNELPQMQYLMIHNSDKSIMHNAIHWKQNN